MQSYNLYKLLKEELKNGSRDLVTRQSGQAIRERIERDIKPSRKYKRDMAVEFT
jgi:hypothetical protein